MAVLPAIPNTEAVLRDKAIQGIRVSPEAQVISNGKVSLRVVRPMVVRARAIRPRVVPSIPEDALRVTDSTVRAIGISNPIVPTKNMAALEATGLTIGMRNVLSQDNRERRGTSNNLSKRMMSVNR
jgi:hypothetical protein